MLQSIILPMTLVLATSSAWASALGTINVPSQSELLRRYQTVSQPVQMASQTVEEGFQKDFFYTIRSLSYVNPKTQNVRSLRLDFYIPAHRTQTQSPTIVMFPTLRGLTRFDTGFAKKFAEEGYVAVISHVVDDIEKMGTIDELALAFENGVRDNMVIMSYLHQLNFVQKDRIGTFGASLGGIRSALLHGMDPRIKATGMVVSGGNLAGIITYSQEWRVAGLRERMMANHGISDLRQLEAILRQRLLYDPIYFSNFLGRQRPMYHAMAEKDAKIPTFYQWEYLTHNSHTTVIPYPAGHIPTVVATLAFKLPVLQFFRTNL